MTEAQFDALKAFINAMIEDKVIDDLHTYRAVLEAEKEARELLIVDDNYNELECMPR